MPVNIKAPKIHALVRDGHRISMHCTDCGRHKILSSSDMLGLVDKTVPELGGRYRCTRCGSRNSSGQVIYSFAGKKGT